MNWFLPSGLGTRRGPKMLLGWPKVEGGAGRIAASGEDVSMTLQDKGACTDVAVCRCMGRIYVVVEVKRFLAVESEKMHAARATLTRCVVEQDVGRFRGSSALDATAVKSERCRSTSVGDDHLGCTC